VLLLWDYTLHKWGYNFLISGISGHNCGGFPSSHQSRAAHTTPQDVLYDNHEVVSRAERYYLPAQAAIQAGPQCYGGDKATMEMGNEASNTL